MKLLKYFFKQTIDVILLIIAIFLFIMYQVSDWNISKAFWIVIGYILFNTIEKARLAIRIDEGQIILFRSLKSRFKVWIRRKGA